MNFSFFALITCVVSVHMHIFFFIKLNKSIQKFCLTHSQKFHLLHHLMRKYRLLHHLNLIQACFPGISTYQIPSENNHLPCQFKPQEFNNQAKTTTDKSLEATQNINNQERTTQQIERKSSTIHNEGGNNN